MITEIKNHLLIQAVLYMFRGIIQFSHFLFCADITLLMFKQEKIGHFLCKMKPFDLSFMFGRRLTHNYSSQRRVIFF